MSWPLSRVETFPAGTGYDRLLRFAPAVDAKYETEQGQDRRQHIARMILFGLVLYNVYNLTAQVLLTDIFVVSVILRVGIVTPCSLVLIVIICRVGPVWRERLLLLGLMNAYLPPLGLFWWSRVPSALLSFNELTLVIVFATVLVALRFRHAILYTAFVLCSTLIALMTKADLTVHQQFAFTIQILTACVFCLFANHHREVQRCRDFMLAHRASHRADSAESSNARMTALSLTDPLTGIANRRSFDRMMQSWVADDTSVALMMIDIDHFKLYNDSLGHPAGDACLQRVASVLLAAADGAGVRVARIGGEEFAIVARSMSVARAKALATRIVGDIRARADPHPGRMDGVGVVTISLGLTVTPAGAPFDRAGLMTRADSALYDAKRAGRDCWRMAGDSPRAVSLLYTA
ncbi:GGDEF domain-containing protein [Loktanella sp. SALINAS62]|uniref:GGDEF domain-containing protein n=1 Tax=Loktanella sp. SALINAS62 TaxID=2706124 RepID=UPI001B8C64C5|nr:GGDEF domain-containing protein [Loktanella sp. SALINAS62]MBS1301038.1 GGDEF domain-containing protein [Loktanella sp. SALINAS62]